MQQRPPKRLRELFKDDFWAGNRQPDHTLANDHEWGRPRLEELLKCSRAHASAADENLIIDMEACARREVDPGPGTMDRRS